MVGMIVAVCVLSVLFLTMAATVFANCRMTGAIRFVFWSCLL